MFGRNPFPRRFGGGANPIVIEHNAMLRALDKGFDVSENSAVYAEAYAHALALAWIWRLNGRLRNQLVPSKMLETLTTWEAACRLRPTPTDSVQDRRRRVAAKFRGIIANTVSDIYDVMAALLGSHFLGVLGPTVADEVTYWPGVNPGPPGFEWTSNRALIAVRTQRLGLDDIAFDALLARAAEMLDAMIPAWMGYQIGTDEGGWVVEIGIVDVTLLGS